METSPPPPPEAPSPKKCQRRKKKKKPYVANAGDGANPVLSTTNSNLCNPQISLAIYIAMAHAVLALSIAILYGLSRLLEQYWRPIQWALLCSMPLRELQISFVAFWAHPLHLGLLETLLAVPLAVLRAATGSVIDSQTALLRLIRRLVPRFPRRAPESGRWVPIPTKIGFSKLMQWLASFGLFVLVNERLGATAALPLFAFPGLVAYLTGYGTPGIARTLSAISSARHRGLQNAGLLSHFCRYLTSGFLKRLNTMVGIGLIISMIVGSIFGFVFFSYKIGIEGKDAVISLKIHFEENNYAERLGLMQWMDENHVPEFIDTYTGKFYQSMSQHIDSIALQYNATEIVDGIRHYFIRPITLSFTSTIPEQVTNEPFSQKLRRLKYRIQKQGWRVTYTEFKCGVGKFLLVIAKDDLVEKVKGFLLQSIDVSKRVFASSAMVLAGSANILFSAVVSVVSGAAELLNFISQLMVFFWVLYYLITSDSGGVMEHALELLPVSKSAKVRCAEVLNHAISSVLLATAKVAIFQGCLTYLLYRFYHIHFLYMSTLLSLMSALLPITPTWFSSVLAAAQLAMEARYIEAIFLTVVHLVLLDYGASAIQDEVEGQSAYLTGLSILGGMALFPSVLEGAIMGPLLMTVVIALKNLYAEFVLAPAKETSNDEEMIH